MFKRHGERVSNRQESALKIETINFKYSVLKLKISNILKWLNTALKWACIGLGSW